MIADGTIKTAATQRPERNGYPVPRNAPSLSASLCIEGLPGIPVTPRAMDASAAGLIPHQTAIVRINPSGTTTDPR